MFMWLVPLKLAKDELLLGLELVLRIICSFFAYNIYYLAKSFLSKFRVKAHI